MPKLFSETECLAIVQAASGRPFCPPLAVKAEFTESLAAPVDSGPAVVIHFSRYPFTLQLREPRGWWVSACGCAFGDNFTRRRVGLLSWA